VTAVDVVVADTVTTGALAMTNGTATTRAALRANPRPPGALFHPPVTAWRAFVTAAMRRMRVRPTLAWRHFVRAKGSQQCASNAGFP
jgi:hypothetical protein